MIAFDFLHASQPPLLRKLWRMRMPPALYAPAGALCVIVFASCGAFAIEASRLRTALALEAACRMHYEQSERQVHETGVQLRRMRQTIELDMKMQAMARSGYRTAERLAAIANALPSHAWLTSIAYDGDDVVLEGRASGLSEVGRVIRGLDHARHLGQPVLANATLNDHAGSEDGMLYTVRLTETRP